MPINCKTTSWNHRWRVNIYYPRISYHMAKFIFRTSILRFSVLSQVPGHDELLADRSWRQANIWRTEENPGGNGEKQQGILISTQCVGMFLLVGQWQGGQSWAVSGFERDCTGQLQLVDHYFPCFLLIAPDKHGQVRQEAVREPGRSFQLEGACIHCLHTILFVLNLYRSWTNPRAGSIASRGRLVSGKYT